MDNINISTIEEVRSYPNTEYHSSADYHSHHHHNSYRRRRYSLIYQLPIILFLKGKVLIFLFFVSFSITIISFFIFFILTLKHFIIPKIFRPSIFLFLLSFIFAGGILGSYMPNQGKFDQMMSRAERYLFRKIFSLCLFLFSICFVFYGLDNIYNIKKKIRDSQSFCKKHNGNSKYDIYNKANLRKEYVEKSIQKYDYIIKNNLSCQYEIKCIKENEKNKYICNTNNFNNNSKILCEEFNNINNNYDNKNIKYFIEGCEELKKYGKKIYKCESLDFNLENFNTNYNNHSNDIYAIDLLKYNKENEDLKKVIKLYDDLIYNYDIYCYSDFEYGFCYLLMNVYCLIFYLISLGWVIVGIEEILILIRCRNEDEVNILNYINNHNLKINNRQNEVFSDDHNNESNALQFNN